MKKKIAVSAAVISAFLAINAGAQNADGKTSVSNLFECVKENVLCEISAQDLLNRLWSGYFGGSQTVPPSENVPGTDYPETDLPGEDTPENGGTDNDGNADGDSTELPEEDSGFSSSSAYVNEVLRLVNEYRTQNGVSALELDRKLCGAAGIRAEEIKSLFSHTRPDGSSCFTVLSELGISYSGAGENIAYGQSSPSEVMTAWINSDGHRENILNSSFTKLGVGVYSSGGTLYWAQIFTR